jgi:hypothetical protein
LPISTIGINVQSSETRLMPCACAFRALGICLPQLASGNPSAHAIHPAEMSMTPKLKLVPGLKSCPPCVCTHPAKTEPANPTPITGLWKTLPHKFWLSAFQPCSSILRTASSNADGHSLTRCELSGGPEPKEIKD